MEDLQSEPTAAAEPSTPVPGAFTHRAGMSGWFEARANQSPVYGSGSLQLMDDTLLIDGWTRSWLGTAIQSQVAVPCRDLLSVACEDHTLHVIIRKGKRREMRLEFRAGSVAAAADLAARLSACTPRQDDAQWTAIREFNAHLRAASGRAVVTPLIVILAVGAYVVLALTTREWAAPSLPTLILWGANTGALTVNGQWWRLWTAGFLHANLLHLLFNMWALWNVGRLTERLFGHLTFLFLYLATLTLASLSTIIWDPGLVSVGASGAIFGIFGAFLAFFLNPRNQVPRSLARQHWVSAGAFVLYNLVSGLYSPAVDNAAHVGGLISGFVLGWLLARPLCTTGRDPWAARRLGTATALFTVSVAFAVWQVKGRGSEPTPVEQFVKAHQSYVEGETSNLRRWLALGQRASAGTLSDLELGQRFEREILPFWKSASAQLEKEQSSLPAAQQPFAALVIEFVRVREAWAEKIIAATRDSARIPEMTALAKKNDALQARLERYELRASMNHRPGALANNRPVLALRRLLSPAYRRCIDAPIVFTPLPQPTDSPSDGPAARHRLGCEAQQLFLAGNYPALDTLMNRTARKLADLPDGSSSYAGITSGLSNLYHYGSFDVREMLGRTADWRRAVPHSASPDIQEAEIFSSLAWRARGTGPASSVPAQAWAIFGLYNEMAAASLEETRQHAPDDPSWYVISLDVGLDRSLDREALTTLYNEGARRFRGYQPLNSAMLRILMPRWGGSYDEVDDFIDHADTLASKDTGFENYAELYARYAMMEGDEVDLFADTHAHWGLMRIGFDGLLKRHPDSDYLLNEFANMACRAQDGDEYHRLRPSLAKRMSSVAWTAKNSLKKCDASLGASPIASVMTNKADPNQPGSDRQGPSAGNAGSTDSIHVLWGIRLGMAIQELLDAKGQPLHQERSYWSYNSVDARHDGLIIVYMRESSGQNDPRVDSIEYTGDEESAPKEVPFLKGKSEAQLLRQLGNPMDKRTTEGVVMYRFSNGIYAVVRRGKVANYGITRAG